MTSSLKTVLSVLDLFGAEERKRREKRFMHVDHVDREIVKEILKDILFTGKNAISERRGATNSKKISSRTIFSGSGLLSSRSDSETREFVQGQDRSFFVPDYLSIFFYRNYFYGRTALNQKNQASVWSSYWADKIIVAFLKKFFSTKME